ncbi:conserved hypothetical protein, secreted [Candidatus Magnetomorum sp. HK-1]|nr:conserved hypothetical protein, secreted [Candidatus Magnetomorum sp. HK-1]
MYPRFFLIILMMCVGCAWNSQPSIPFVLQNVTLKYDKPYPLKSIPEKSFLYITCARSGNYDQSQALINSLKKRFRQNAYFQITDNIDLKSKYPTYILNINHYVQSPKQKARKSGIQDMHEIENICKQTDALISHVSLYDPNHFEIQYVFMLKSLAKKTFEDDIEESFECRLSRQIFNRLNTMINVSSKSIDVYIPGSMDQKGRNFLVQYQYEQAKSRLKAILPAFDFSKQSSTKILNKYTKWHRMHLRNIETDLTNYYGYLLACEAGEISEKKLYSIFKGYQSILGITKTPQLIKACSHALGRLESQLSQRLYPM